MGASPAMMNHMPYYEALQNRVPRNDPPPNIKKGEPIKVKNTVPDFSGNGGNSDPFRNLL
jgi:hypothetical protein